MPWSPLPLPRVVIAVMAASTLPAAEISVSGGRALLKSESLERVIRFDDGNVRTTGFRVGGREVLAAPAHEFSVAISREQSNRQPRGLRPGETTEKNDFSTGNRGRWRAEAFDPARYDDTRPDAPKWVDTRLVEASSWSLLGGKPTVCYYKSDCTNFLSIDSDGTIYVCGRTLGQKKFQIGNITSQQLEDLIASKKFQEIRKSMISLPHECTSCEWRRVIGDNYVPCHRGCDLEERSRQHPLQLNRVQVVETGRKVPRTKDTGRRLR